MNYQNFAHAYNQTILYLNENINIVNPLVFCGFSQMIKQLERVELGRIVLEAGDFWKESLCVFAAIESPNYQIIGIPSLTYYTPRN